MTSVSSIFKLIPTFKAKPHIAELNLTTVLLEPKLDFPWILLIPRRTNTDGQSIVQMNHLSIEDQIQLIKEIDLASNIMEKLFPCDRLNVAAIGNMSPQLHIHVICRRKDDPLFPDVVWNKPMTEMTESQVKERLELLKAGFNGKNV